MIEFGCLRFSLEYEILGSGSGLWFNDDDICVCRRQGALATKFVWTTELSSLLSLRNWPLNEKNIIKNRRKKRNDGNSVAENQIGQCVHGSTKKTFFLFWKALAQWSLYLYLSLDRVGGEASPRIIIWCFETWKINKQCIHCIYTIYWAKCVQIYKPQISKPNDRRQVL